MFQPRIQSFVLRLPYALKPTPLRLRSNLLHSPVTRNISLTPPRRATEPLNNDSAALLAAFKETSTFKKFSQHPGVLLALQNFVQVMQKQGGVDPSKPMSPPTMLQMSKWLLNAEFREAMKNLTEEFKKAGIDPQDKTMMEELTKIMKMMPKP